MCSGWAVSSGAVEGDGSGGLLTVGQVQRVGELLERGAQHHPCLVALPGSGHREGQVWPQVSRKRSSQSAAVPTAPALPEPGAPEAPRVPPSDTATGRRAGPGASGYADSSS